MKTSKATNLVEKLNLEFKNRSIYIYLRLPNTLPRNSYIFYVIKKLESDNLTSEQIISILIKDERYSHVIGAFEFNYYRIEDEQSSEITNVELTIRNCIIENLKKIN